MSYIKEIALVLGKAKQKYTTNPWNENLYKCSMHSQFRIIQIVPVG